MASLGFNDSSVINKDLESIEPKYLNLINLDNKADLLAMFDKLTRIAEGRRITPHDQLNNVNYTHRSMLISSYNLQLGDTYFMVPPEFICVTSESTSQQLITLRQENSMRQKAGSHKRTLLIDLVFNNYDQINGYKVAGPESIDGKDYYVDGLRQLLAQFKCTPFLPIQNEFINGVHGIFTVVLQGINISTVPGFPNLMKAQLTLQEVDMFPYLEVPSIMFKAMIDWDLFRYYYQRFLTETYEYKKLQSLPATKNYNRFKLSILKNDVFTETETEEKTTSAKYKNKEANLISKLCNDDNYETWVDSSKDNIYIKEFQCGYYNLLTNIQMNDCPCPTVQFMGGMDTIFNLSLETTDELVVNAFEQACMYNDSMTRNNAQYRSLGFVKFDSELVSFTGSLFVVIENVVVSTTPDFPGLYQIQVQCVSFDIGQSLRENINGFLPFDDEIASKFYNKNYSGECSRVTDDGYVSDHTHEEQCIEQSMDGLFTKIRQDCYAEWKLRSSIEVYPDLYLPTYSEVNEFITKCNNFRTSFDLEPLPYTEYPVRPECMVQGIPITNNIQTPNDRVILAKDINRGETVYTGFVDPDFYVFYPDSYSSYGVDEYDYEPKTRTGFSKTIITNDMPFGEDNIASYSNNSLIEAYIQKICSTNGSQYILGTAGPNTWDCSGLVCWGLIQIGVMGAGERYYTHDFMNNKYLRKVNICSNNRSKLSFIFIPP